MIGHRERLISNGLLHPFSMDEICRRNGLLKRIADGEKMDSDKKPIFCVFRADGAHKHIILTGDSCCKDAELIAEKLMFYEAFILCNKLNAKDTDLPLWHEKSAYRQELYKVCSIEEWNEWTARNAQMSIFNEGGG